MKVLIWLGLLDPIAGDPKDWSPKSLSNAEAASLQNVDLLKSYDGPISQYLCHCTPKRAERDIEWRHIEMYEKIAPLLANFRKLFPTQSRGPKEVFMSDAASTATMSTCALYIEDLPVTSLKKTSK